MKTFIAATAIAIIVASSAQAQSADASSQSYSSSGISNQGDRVNSATAFAPSGNNTAPCVLHPSVGIGIAELGAGFSKGSPYVDKKCLLRLEARMLAEIAAMPGMSRTAAIVHLASDPDLHRTMVAIGWLKKVQK